MGRGLDGRQPIGLICPLLLVPAKLLPRSMLTSSNGAKD